MVDPCNHPAGHLLHDNEATCSQQLQSSNPNLSIGQRSFNRGILDRLFHIRTMDSHSAVEKEPTIDTQDNFNGSPGMMLSEQTQYQKPPIMSLYSNLEMTKLWRTH